MDDGADVGWLRTEDLCGLSTSMNTIDLRKQQPFGGFKQFKSKAHMNFPETWLIMICSMLSATTSKDPSTSNFRYEKISLYVLILKIDNFLKNTFSV